MLVYIDGPFVTTGVIDQRAIGFVDILERHPYPAHEPFRHRTEVNGIRVKMLLGADREIERLERSRGPAIEDAQESTNCLVHGNSLAVGVELPRILNTWPFVLVVILGRAAPVETVFKRP